MDEGNLECYCCCLHYGFYVIQEVRGEVIKHEMVGRNLVENLKKVDNISNYFHEKNRSLVSIESIEKHCSLGLQICKLELKPMALKM